MNCRAKARCKSCGSTVTAGALFCANCGATLIPEENQSQPVGRRAGFWMRFSAAGMDVFIVAFTVVLAAFLNQKGDISALIKLTPGIWPEWLLLIPPLYFWLLTGFRGQTAGKMFFGIKVVNEAGTAAGVWRAALRETVGKAVSLILIPFFMIVSLTSTQFSYPARHDKIIDSNFQYFHDKIARTLVIDIDEPSAIRNSNPFWWLLVFLSVIGGIIGLVLLWNKDRRKAWGIFWSGLLMSLVITILVYAVVISVWIGTGHF